MMPRGGCQDDEGVHILEGHWRAEVSTCMVYP